MDGIVYAARGACARCAGADAVITRRLGFGHLPWCGPRCAPAHLKPLWHAVAPGSDLLLRPLVRRFIMSVPVIFIVAPLLDGENWPDIVASVMRST